QNVPDFMRMLDEYRIQSTLLAPSTPAVGLLDRLPDWKRACRRRRRRARASLSRFLTVVNRHPQASTRRPLWYSIVSIGGRHGCRVALRGKAMSLQALIILIIVGAIAGWLAGIIVKGVGFGLVGNIIVGIVGAFIGTWVLGALGIMIGGGILASIINA